MELVVAAGAKVAGSCTALKLSCSVLASLRRKQMGQVAGQH